jgi:quaternary ammonium compound-resistance protein SugE
MAWIALLVAGALEVVWAFYMKQSVGFTRLPASLITLFAMAASFGLLAWAMRTIPLGVAYPAWTGIGAIGSVALGALVLGEPFGPTRLVAVAMIVVGLILLK